MLYFMSATLMYNGSLPKNDMKPSRNGWNCDVENAGSQGSSSAGAKDYGIDIDILNFTNTVLEHPNRPYQDSILLINEIIESKAPVPDPQGTLALYWEVEGSFNGSTGVYELLIEPETNTVWHFLYRKN